MRNKQILSAIAAVGNNYEIGVGDTLPWRISSELRYFKEVTDGKVLIVGRKTYETLPPKLSNRTLIVVTSDKEYHKKLPSDVYAVSDMEDAVSLATALTRDEIVVIGGATIYAQVAAKIKKLYLTVVNVRTEKATAFFPIDDYLDFLGKSKVVSTENVPKNTERNEPSYIKIVYEKRT